MHIAVLSQGLLSRIVARGNGSSRYMSINKTINIFMTIICLCVCASNNSPP